MCVCLFVFFHSPEPEQVYPNSGDSAVETLSVCSNFVSQSQVYFQIGGKYEKHVFYEFVATFPKSLACAEKNIYLNVKQLGTAVNSRKQDGELDKDIW